MKRRNKERRRDWEDKKELTSTQSTTGRVCVLLQILDSKSLLVKVVHFN